jgi:hypothetical protein
MRAKRQRGSTAAFFTRALTFFLQSFDFTVTTLWPVLAGWDHERIRTMKTIIVSLLLLGANAGVAESNTNYVAHEWGTFTSVQGGDGKLLAWRPLRTSELPDFVYNWSRPGMNRRLSATFGGKGDVTTSLGQGLAAAPWLQRMETPVIYFYSDHQMTANVGVSFPSGLITEWYPQASQIGPSAPRTRNSDAQSATLPESRAIWNDVTILPNQPGDLRQDGSGSHYFAAREAEANRIAINPHTPANGLSETEKFIFYRGAGNFTTPLRVSVNTSNTLVVANTGKENLASLFLVSIHDGQGVFSQLDGLAPGNSIEWDNMDSISSGERKHSPLLQFKNEIAPQLETALVREGLFPAEARAMVDTWKDSWFAEEGNRVLYILPRVWTDRILPLTLDPKPRELVRVMVGRAEIITPRVESTLSQALTEARRGDKPGRQRAISELKKLGRFAEPALRLAGVQSPTAIGTLSRDLLAEIAQPIN